MREDHRSSGAFQAIERQASSPHLFAEYYVSLRPQFPKRCRSTRMPDSNRMSEFVDICVNRHCSANVRRPEGGNSKSTLRAGEAPRTRRDQATERLFQAVRCQLSRRIPCAVSETDEPFGDGQTLRSIESKDRSRYPNNPQE